MATLVAIIVFILFTHTFSVDVRELGIAKAPNVYILEELLQNSQNEQDAPFKGIPFVHSGLSDADDQGVKLTEVSVLSSNNKSKRIPKYEEESGPELSAYLQSTMNISASAKLQLSEALLEHQIFTLTTQQLQSGNIHLNPSKSSFYKSSSAMIVCLFEHKYNKSSSDWIQLLSIKYKSSNDKRFLNILHSLSQKCEKDAYFVFMYWLQQKIITDGTIIIFNDIYSVEIVAFALKNLKNTKALLHSFWSKYVVPALYDYITKNQHNKYIFEMKLNPIFAAYLSCFTSNAVTLSYLQSVSESLSFVPLQSIYYDIVQIERDLNLPEKQIFFDQWFDDTQIATVNKAMSYIYSYQYEGASSQKVSELIPNIDIFNAFLYQMCIHCDSDEEYDDSALSYIEEAIYKEKSICNIQSQKQNIYTASDGHVYIDSDTMSILIQRYKHNEHEQLLLINEVMCLCLEHLSRKRCDDLVFNTDIMGIMFKELAKIRQSQKQRKSNPSKVKDENTEEKQKLSVNQSMPLYSPKAVFSPKPPTIDTELAFRRICETFEAELSPEEAMHRTGTVPLEPTQTMRPRDVIRQLRSYAFSSLQINTM